MADRARV